MFPSDGEVRGPENDEKTTHVIVVDLFETTDHIAFDIARVVEDGLKARGLVPGAHYQIISGAPTDLLSALKSPSDGPSRSQIGYIQKLYANVHRLYTMANLRQTNAGDMDTNVLIVSKDVLECVIDEMRTPISKRRASQFIDALKDLETDLRAELSGL